MDTVRKLLAANIKAKRSELGLTQEKLAELVDVSYQMIHFTIHMNCLLWRKFQTPRISPAQAGSLLR
jgi:transcriptional regulator with XRE-family HTH domain